jgi:hypothetical protein
MPVTLDATVGGVNANTYCTQAEADTFHDTQPYPAIWTAATSDNKNRALVTATRILDDEIAWYGVVTDQKQRLQWPRQGMVKPNGYYVDPNTLPDALKNATAELARQLLDTDRSADNDAETQGIAALKIGSIDLTFKNPTAKVIPDAVFYMLRWWGSVITRSSPVTPLMRG